MDSIKCSSCNLVNVPGATVCRRCQASLAPTTPDQFTSGSSPSVAAAIPPRSGGSVRAGAKSKNSTLLYFGIGIGSVFVLFFVVAFLKVIISLPLKSEKIIVQPTTSSTPAKRMMTDVKPVDHAPTISGILQDYENGGLAADAKYKNKLIIIVGGEVASTGTDVLGDPYVTLQDPLAGSGPVAVQCYIDRDNGGCIRAASQLTKGSRVLIEGICQGKSFNVVLRHCIIGTESVEFVCDQVMP